MLNAAFDTLGHEMRILSPDGIQTGTAKARIHLLKNNARVLYREDIAEPGVLNDETFVYLGDCDQGGDTVQEEGYIQFGKSLFLVLRCDLVSVKKFRLVWAVLKKLPVEANA